MAMIPATELDQEHGADLQTLRIDGLYTVMGIDPLQRLCLRVSGEHQSCYIAIPLDELRSLFAQVDTRYGDAQHGT